MTVTLVSFAFFFGMLISRIGLPPMVGFLVAGFAYNFAGFETPDSLQTIADLGVCLLYTSPSPRDATLSRMPSSA